MTFTKDLFLNRQKSDRSDLLDCLRGWTVLNMVLFHGLWDFFHVFDVKSEWFYNTPGFLWQQMICCTFILLSGFCAAMGRKAFRRGLVIFGLGFVITAVTAIAAPEEIICFGVLTLIGSCMMLTGLLKTVLQKISSQAGVFISLLLFIVTRGVNKGYIGVFFWEWRELPEALYRNYVTAYLGFPFDGFYSTDYFSLLPWLFLFLCGFYLYGVGGKQILAVKWKGIQGFNFIGRHALIIYVLHQPFLYGLMIMLQRITG